MNWIRAHYDRVAVIAAAVFLLLCAFFIWRSASSFPENFSSLQAAGPARPVPPLPAALELDSAAQKLREPAQWTFGGRSGLFVPEKHFIGPDGMPATLQSTEVHPPVPNEWLEQFALPIGDADVLAQDPDGDGYTNLEEWQGHTNPTDKNSHPPFIAKLKVKSVGTEPFRLVFASHAGDTFTINTTDLKEPTQFLKIGDVISGTSFKIMSFEEKHSVNAATSGDVDVSELLLQHEETGDRVTLVKEKTMTSPQAIVTFVYQWGQPREFSVKKGQEFSLPPQMEIRYKTVEVAPNRVVIINTQKPDERIEVQPLAP